MRRLIACIYTLVLSSMIFCAGCGPTYPALKVEESITNLCKKEYGVDVKAKLEGKTLGVYHALDASIIDEAGNISKDAIEQMGNIFLIVSRVALSTDAEIEFCVAVIADPKYKMEWMITRYLQDIKMMYFRVAREEIFRRTDFDLRPIKEEGAFELEEVQLSKFLARQIASRIKSKFTTDKKLSSLFEIQMLQSDFKVPEVVSFSSGNNRNFAVYYSLKAKETTIPKVNEEELMNTIICQIISYMVNIYEFSVFDGVEVVNMGTLSRFFINKMEINEIYAKKKIDKLLQGVNQ